MRNFWRNSWIKYLQEFWSPSSLQKIQQKFLKKSQKVYLGNSNQESVEADGILYDIACKSWIVSGLKDQRNDKFQELFATFSNVTRDFILTFLSNEEHRALYLMYDC